MRSTGSILAALNAALGCWSIEVGGHLWPLNFGAAVLLALLTITEGVR